MRQRPVWRPAFYGSLVGVDKIEISNFSTAPRLLDYDLEIPIAVHVRNRNPIGVVSDVVAPPLCAIVVKANDPTICRVKNFSLIYFTYFLSFAINV